MSITRIASLKEPLTQKHRLRVEENAPLVTLAVNDILRRMSNDIDFHEWGDLFQEGIFGLMYAVMIEESKPDDVRWTTFAQWHIRRAIRRAIEGQERAIRLPTYVHTDITVLRKTIDELRQNLEREPNIPEIAEAMGVDEAHVWELRKYIYQSPGHMPEKVDESDIIDIDEEPTVASVFESAYPEEEPNVDIIEEEILEHVMDSTMMSDRERKVLERVVGNEESMADLARDMKVTRQRVEQLKNRALNKLRDDSRIRRMAETHDYVAPDRRTNDLYKYGRHEPSFDEWVKEYTVPVEMTPEVRAQWAYGSRPVQMLYMRLGEEYSG